MDTHIYQIFSQSDVEMSQQQHISAACAEASNLGPFDLWTIVGEWTPASTDCAKYLNGRGVGSRYDGSFPGSTRVGSCTGLTGPASSFSSSYKTFLRQFWEAQVCMIFGCLNHSNGWLGRRIRIECWVDPVVMEGSGWHCRRMVLPGWPSQRLDPQQPNSTPVPQHMLLIAKTPSRSLS